MRKLLIVLATMFFLGTSVGAFGAVVATVVDKEGVKIDLERVTSSWIAFRSGIFEIDIPSKLVASIHLAENEEDQILKTISGIELRGIGALSMSGEWELGDYSVSLPDIRSLDFNMDIWPDRAPEAPKLDDYELPCTVVMCSDRSGNTMELFALHYERIYWYDSPYWNEESGPRFTIESYVPIMHKEAKIIIPFANIDNIELSERKSGNPSKELLPDANIKLLGGQSLKGRLVGIGNRPNLLRFSGTVFGEVIIPEVHKITFDHRRDKNMDKLPVYDGYMSESIEESKYTIMVKTWKGNEFTFLNGCLFDINDEGDWASITTSFEVNVGSSVNTVEFDKIRGIRFAMEGKPDAQITTTSGKTIKGSLPNIERRWLGGKIDETGLARVGMSAISSLEIKDGTN